MVIFNKDKVAFSIVIYFIITTALLGYFIFQIFRLEVFENISAKEYELESKISNYEQVKSELSNYEKRIKALSPETLDKDFLEEKAREKLNYNKKNEVVIFK